MCHRGTRRRAVPMLLPGRANDDVARTDDSERFAPALHVTAAAGDHQLLAQGWLCQLLREPGSNVTTAALVRAGAVDVNSGSTRTVPVKYSVGPFAEGCEPLRLSSMFRTPLERSYALATPRLFRT